MLTREERLHAIAARLTSAGDLTKFLKEEISDEIGGDQEAVEDMERAEELIDEAYELINNLAGR